MRRVLTCLAAALAVTIATAADKPQDAERSLKAAMNKELVDGDLKGAIEQYKRLGKSSDRAVAAQALLHMAECYEKLGDAQARKIFDQVIRDYPEQKDVVAAARARLGAEQTVEFLDGAWSGPSLDGRYIARAGPPVGSGVVVRDLSTNTDRTTPADGVIRRMLVTPGGKQILYYWRKQVSPSNVPAELRIINVDGTGVRTLIPARDYNDLEAAALTADGKIAAVSLSHNDGKAWDLGLLTIETGKLQVLRTFRDVFAGNFSPDGRWLVYASLPDTPGSADAGVYTIATDGSGAVNALASSAKLSKPFFTPDGSRVAYLVTGETEDHVDLWSVKTANGMRAGDPELTKARVADSSAFIPKTPQPNAFGIGLGRDGSYWLYSSSQTSAFYLSGVDPGTGRPTGTAQRISDPARRPFVTQPRWSPDGTSLAYVSDLAEAIIVIRNMSSGAEREIRTGVTNLNLIGWQPDGKSLEVSGPVIGHQLIDMGTGGRTALGGTAPASSGDASQREVRPGGGQVAYVTVERPRVQTVIFKGLFEK